MHTVGSLDLGGSSLEVTFVPKPGAPIVDIRDSRARSARRVSVATVISCHDMWLAAK